MKSILQELNQIQLPLVLGEYKMIPFNIQTLEGLPEEFKDTATQMLKGIKDAVGTAYFTIHGKILKKGETLRRPGPHTDGNYEPVQMTFGGGGWKVGENGPQLGTPLHARQYVTDRGGIIMASNYYACNAWVGEFEALPLRGGDCSHIELGDPLKLKPNTVYYGNNHMIHESLPMADDVHRVMARITMPEHHEYGLI